LDYIRLGYISWKGLKRSVHNWHPDRTARQQQPVGRFFIFFLARLTISVDSAQSRRQFRTGQKTFLWFYSVQFNVLKLAKKTSRDFYLV
jgi:hypothetical protein